MSKKALKQIIQEEISKLMQEFDINFRSPIEIEVEEEFPELELDTSFLDDDPDDWDDENSPTSYEGGPEISGVIPGEIDPVTGVQTMETPPEPFEEPGPKPKKRRGSRAGRWNKAATERMGGSSKADYNKFAKENTN